MMDLSGITIDMTDFIQISVFLITALAAYLGVKYALYLSGLHDSRKPSNMTWEHRGTSGAVLVNQKTGKVSGYSGSSTRW